MSGEITKRPTAIARSDGIEQIEAAMLNMPQVECPVSHRTGGGVYIREASMPKGALILGHKHKLPCWNQMIKGRMILIKDGVKELVEAPFTFLGASGEQKLAYMLEDVVWQNIWENPDNETDIRKLEERYIDESRTWKDFDADLSRMKTALRENEREDFLLMLSDLGLDSDKVRILPKTRTIRFQCHWNGRLALWWMSPR